MQQPIRTDYDRPWVSKQERERQTKDYLKDTSQINVDLNFDEQELPSHEQLI